MFRYSVQFLLLLLTIFNIIQLCLTSEKYAIKSVDYVGKLVKISIESPVTKSMNHNAVEYLVKSNFVQNVTNNIGKEMFQNFVKDFKIDNSNKVQDDVKKTKFAVFTNRKQTSIRKMSKIVKSEIISELVEENILNNSTIDTKIIGGSLATQNEFPSIVAILISSLVECGGTLIHENFIITAAHCANHEPSLYLIRAGSILWDQGGFISQVSEIFINSNYNPNNLNYDIAIMKLKPGFGKYLHKALISLAPLPNKPAYKIKGCIVAGWGTLTEKSNLTPKKLRKLKVKIIFKSNCSKLLQNKLNACMLCATGSLNGGRDHCFGDSGGPLYCKGYLSGIISWAFDCARPNTPGVYTNVYYMRKWIKQILNK